MDEPRSTEPAQQQHRKHSHTTNKSTTTSTSGGKAPRSNRHSRKVPVEQKQQKQPNHDQINSTDMCTASAGKDCEDHGIAVQEGEGGSKMRSKSKASHAKQKQRQQQQSRRKKQQRKLLDKSQEEQDHGVNVSVPNGSVSSADPSALKNNVTDPNGVSKFLKGEKSPRSKKKKHVNDKHSEFQSQEELKQGEGSGHINDSKVKKKKKKQQAHKSRKNSEKKLPKKDNDDVVATNGPTGIIDSLVNTPAAEPELKSELHLAQKFEQIMISSGDDANNVELEKPPAKNLHLAEIDRHFIDINVLSKSKSKSKDGKKKNKKKKKKIDESLLENLTVSLLDVHSVSTLTSLLSDHAEVMPLPIHVIDQVLQQWMTQAKFVLCSKLLLENQKLDGHRLSIWQSEGLLICLPQNIRGGSPYELLELIDNLASCTQFGFDNKKQDNRESSMIKGEDVRNYWCRIVRGICLEFIEEALSCRDRLCSSTALALRQSNACLYPLTFTPSAQNNSNNFTYTAILPNNVKQTTSMGDLGGRGWVPGDAVGVLPCTTNSYEGVSRVTPAVLDEFLIEGSILSYTTSPVTKSSKITLRLNVPLPIEYISSLSYRVDKLANRMSYNRLLHSVCALCCNTRNKNPTLLRILTSTPQAPIVSALCTDKIGLNLTDPEDIYADAGGSAADGTGRLNTSQQQAVITALRQRLTLIQGPPGTGKTQVAIRILHCLCRMRNQSQQGKVLAVSDSNIAVDNLVAGCAELGLRVLRLGRPESVRQDLLRYCLPGTFGNSSSSDHSSRKQMLQSADIICTTCIGAGTTALQNLNLNFNYVLIDEASQCTEAAVLVPIQLASRQSQQCQVALIGDHCQLPPTVLSRLACEAPTCLHIPLFTRLTNSHPDLQDGVICLLDTQYRMHPGIAQFVSDVFYCGRLKDGVSGAQRRALKGFPWPRMEFPVAFVPIYAMENESSSEHSRFNEAEAEAAVHAVEALISGGQCIEGDIAIVTPYAAQVRLIRRMLSMRANQYKHALNFNQIEVSSTDGFQGREKEAIIFSTVRSNQSQTTGFTSDWRRMNVSFTRARRALIVIGNDHTLRHGVQTENSNSNSVAGENSMNMSMWALWLSWVDAHGLNMDRPGAVRGRYDAELMRKIRAVNTATMESSPDGKQKPAAGSYPESPVIGKENDEEDLQLLRQDLAECTNSEGHWDDSDDESHAIDNVSEHVAKHQISSRNTSLTNSSGEEEEEVAMDAWDM